MSKIIVSPDDTEVEVLDGDTIFQALTKAGIDVPNSCNGHGTCGMCRVIILDGENNLSNLTKRDHEHLGNAYFISKTRLACQAFLKGDLVKLKIKR